MDAPDLAEQPHLLALRGLRRVNLLSRTAHIVSSAIYHHWKQDRQTLRVLDLACGGGDVTVQVAERLQRYGVAAEVHGWDRSPTAIEFARQQLVSGKPQPQFDVADALAEISADKFDVIYCTLFLHHLDDHDARQLLTRMYQAASRLVLIDDLRRSTVGYGLAVLGCRVLSRSPIVHVDGPLSVRAAFTEGEIMHLADACALPRPTIKRHWPHRFLLAWDRTR